MIAHLSGTVTHVGPTSAVIDLAGFGVLVQLTPDTSASLRVGQQATLSTALVVREDSLTVYAFATEAERDCFWLLLGASGIGPKIAQAVLSVLGPAELGQAIAADDLRSLTQVPGIGRKGAERMVIELRDKIHPLAAVSATAQERGQASAEWREQVAAGLQGLGWSARDADTACERVAHLVEEDPDVSIPVLMRAALQSLAKK